MKPGMATIDVIIPSRAAQLLPAVAAALESQTHPAKRIIFVRDRYRRGASWARNQGLYQCQSPYVACLDDDCIPPPDWLESILQAFEAFDADIVGGTYEESDPFLADRRARQSWPLTCAEDSGGWVGAGGNIAFRRSLLLQKLDRDKFIFNPSFPMSQDWELVWRLRAMGAKTVFNPVRVRHLKRQTTMDYWWQQFHRGQGIYRLNQLQKSLPPDVPRHRSLLWPDKPQPLLMRVARLLWLKALGPFDVASFSRYHFFLRFWVGEKCQSLGYLWKIAQERFKVSKRSRHLRSRRKKEAVNG